MNIEDWVKKHGDKSAKIHFEASKVLTHANKPVDADNSTSVLCREIVEMAEPNIDIPYVCSRSTTLQTPLTYNAPAPARSKEPARQLGQGLTREATLDLASTRSTDTKEGHPPPPLLSWPTADGETLKISPLFAVGLRSEIARRVQSVEHNKAIEDGRFSIEKLEEMSTSKQQEEVRKRRASNLFRASWLLAKQAAGGTKPQNVAFLPAVNSGNYLDFKAEDMLCGFRALPRKPPNKNQRREMAASMQNSLAPFVYIPTEISAELDAVIDQLSNRFSSIGLGREQGRLQIVSKRILGAIRKHLSANTMGAVPTNEAERYLAMVPTDADIDHLAKTVLSAIDEHQNSREAEKPHGVARAMLLTSLTDTLGSLVREAK